ncbi:response regulator [Hyalangium versicolor]|uniref:response regulator n=1 Tax=Hyalangium versicolor TaxID=2861190 RepID=UPI001CCDF326|nr:response regulator [Hyalangium versicolor]
MPSSNRVLVVEDDLEIRESIMEILEDHGYEPLGAENGLEALDRLREPEPPPCLILLDLMLPRMDGKTFRQELLRHPGLANIPVVVISAFRDARKLIEDMQVSGLLQKPFKVHELVDVTRRYCLSRSSP